MDTKRWLAVVCAAVLVASAVQAAVFTNPGFDDTFTRVNPDPTLGAEGWDVDLLPETNLAFSYQDVVQDYAAAPSNNVLKLFAANTYHYPANQWVRDQSVVSNSRAYQVVFPDESMQSLTTFVVNFKAAAQYSGTSIHGSYQGDFIDQPVVLVTISYTDLNGDGQTVVKPIADSIWSARQVTISDVDATGPILIRLDANSEINAREPGVQSLDPGSVANVTTIGYFDDFTLTPEPATLTLLALGGLTMLRRRR